MTNHPQRGWRTRMHAECAGWLGRYRLPEDGVGMLTPDQLRDVIRETYLRAYQDGRESRTPRKTT